MEVSYDKIKLFLSIFTLVATTFITIGALFFTVKYQGNELISLQNDVSSLQDNSFTVDHALRDFKFVKDDENTLYKRLDTQVTNILSLSTRMDNQTKSIVGLDGRMSILESQVYCKLGTKEPIWYQAH